ncbi:hypothetical protein BT93_H1032 [Corymbia citriodora subsp. variegata]|nr:hypothetical protein BT93_H1032 [Corymbia citriodora subsp. variegata]
MERSRIDSDRFHMVSSRGQIYPNSLTPLAKVVFPYEESQTDHLIALAKVVFPYEESQTPVRNTDGNSKQVSPFNASETLESSLHVSPHQTIFSSIKIHKVQKKIRSLRRRENDLASARVAIREAVRARNYTSDKEETFIPRGSIYRNAYAFHQLSSSPFSSCVHLFLSVLHNRNLVQA